MAGAAESAHGRDVVVVVVVVVVVRALRPGEQPAARLYEALDLPPGQSFVAADGIAALLAPRGLDSSVLLVVDQLEELFTLASAGERDAFLAALRALRAERHRALGPDRAGLGCHHRQVPYQSPSCTRVRW